MAPARPPPFRFSPASWRRPPARPKSSACPPAKPARNTGYLTQSFSLYPDLTVAENIRYIGDLRRVPPDEIAERGRRYLRMFDMDRFEHRLAGQLSGGMKQKLALACALVPQPRVLLLDEPTTGVDPVSRREFWDTLAHLAAEGLTIVVATPYLDEAERCHRVALMHQGEIRQTGHSRRIAGQPACQPHGTPHVESGRARSTCLPAWQARGQDIVDVQRFGDRLDCWCPTRSDARPSSNAGTERSGSGDRRTSASTSRRSKTLSSPVCGASAREMHDEPFPGAATSTRRCRDKSPSAPRDLTKQFGVFTAVKEVNLQVRYGEIYGLLGANGAGKTTTIKMLCGLLDPTSGEMQLAGRTEQSAFRRSAPADRLHVAEILALRRSVHRRESGLLRRRVRRARTTSGKRR